MAREFLPYDLDQQYLLPPSMRDWVPADHLIWFVSDLVDALDLSAILAEYEKDDLRGRAGYHPVMLTKLLLYAYCVGRTSSRRLERATYEEVPFRVLAADQHPDHDTIAAFRRRHLPALGSLFLQVLRLCQEAGLVQLGHVALDGTKVKANASKHKAMSYARLAAAEEALTRTVERLLHDAERIDVEEDARYGEDRRGDELPPEFAHREGRLRKIREAKAALEREAREKAEEETRAAEARLAERERKEHSQGSSFGGRPPIIPDPAQAEPRPKDQKNFTDPESRLMVDGATGAFIQAYNAHAAVDERSQIIVAASVTQAANDKRAFRPLLAQVKANLDGLPTVVSADSGFFSEANLTDPNLAAVDCYVPPESYVKHAAIARTMREKLAGDAGAAVYARRKAIVEPVFGQIKEARRFRRFRFRGRCPVEAEWQLVCLTHNLLELFRAKRGLAPITRGGGTVPPTPRGRRERIVVSALASTGGGLLLPGLVA